METNACIDLDLFEDIQRDGICSADVENSKDNYVDQSHPWSEPNQTRKNKELWNIFQVIM